jgi:hypothetical protein
MNCAPRAGIEGLEFTWGEKGEEMSREEIVFSKPCHPTFQK